MNFNIGVGKYDITGPCVGVGFLGYWYPKEKGTGILSRLYSRAYVIEDPDQGKIVAIVCADMMSCTQAVQQAVLKKLKRNYGDVFSDQNVLIAGTHTHSAPSGYSHYYIYNDWSGAFNEQNFHCITDGIFKSICNAYKKRKPGKILIAVGQVEDCGKNRSYTAYENNIEVKNNPCDPLPSEFKEMTLLKFVDSNGQAIGSLNWYALHPTNFGELNKFITGDNKGHAAELFEMEKPRVVSAFANSCCGDISPNVDLGIPGGELDLERAMTFGKRQYCQAKKLFESDAEELSGGIDYRQTYFDISHCCIEGTNHRTWPAALGLSATAGSSEDSKPIMRTLWREGTTQDSIERDHPVINKILLQFPPVIERIFFPLLERVWFPYFERPKKPHTRALRFPVRIILLSLRGPVRTIIPTHVKHLSEKEINGQYPKPILLPAGKLEFHGVPLAPWIMPLQLIRIGKLILIAHPGEMTTMAGRRMRKTILDIFAGADVKHAVVATYAGAYSSYTTTKEEYDMQHYEGASTLYGPWTLEAYLQENAKLARAMRDNKPIGPGPKPPDWSRQQETKDVRVAHDSTPRGRGFGDVIKQPKLSYRCGEKTVVKFWGASPNNNLRIGETYLEVQKRDDQDSEKWIVVYEDKDLCTRFRWERKGKAKSIVTIIWGIPPEDRGIYRIVYHGDWKSKSSKGSMQLHPFTGTSREFTVTPR
jgi:neutral ceramidase